jgi:3-oxoacyl-[acyl-carrier-protein] synthase III
MYGLAIGSSTLQAMAYRRAACIAIEFSSRCISYDPIAFGTSTLFGDAAAGVLLSSEDQGLATIKKYVPVRWWGTQTIGMIRGGGMQAAQLAFEVPWARRWFMAGPPVALVATRILIDEIKRYQEAGCRIDWLIPHQANLTRILIPRL